MPSRQLDLWHHRPRARRCETEWRIKLFWHANQAQLFHRLVFLFRTHIISVLSIYFAVEKFLREKFHISNISLSLSESRKSTRESDESHKDVNKISVISDTTSRSSDNMVFSIKTKQRMFAQLKKLVRIFVFSWEEKWWAWERKWEWKSENRGEMRVKVVEICQTFSWFLRYLGSHQLPKVSSTL